MSGAAGMGPVLIMAGGTGGHVFPALAVAKVLRERGVPVVWLGVPGSMESRLVPANGFPIEWVRVARHSRQGPARRGCWRRLRVAGAVLQSLRILRRVRPRAVLGAGGYVSGPGGIAAWLLRIPLLIHEQNAIAGLTNRWLSRIATHVLEAFPGSFDPRSARPHRRQSGARRHRRHPGAGGALRGPRRARDLLVFGGSQGAQRLNAVVPQALSRLDPSRRPNVRHQAGERGLAAARAAYAALRVEAEVLPFIEDMAAAYAWADLALCRAGAMTIAELAGGRPGRAPGAVGRRPPTITRPRTPRPWCGSGPRECCPERELTPDALSAMHRGAHGGPGADAQDGAGRTRRPQHRRGVADWRTCACAAGERTRHERSHAPHPSHSSGRHRRQRHGRHRRGAAQPGLRRAGLGSEAPTP